MVFSFFFQLFFDEDLSEKNFTEMSPVPTGFGSGSRSYGGDRGRFGGGDRDRDGGGGADQERSRSVRGEDPAVDHEPVSLRRLSAAGGSDPARGAGGARR